MSAYAAAAPFYDAVAADSRADLDALITAALIGLDTRAGPVLDIGAGTGLTTRVIAKTLPEAEIWAIEPDPVMCSALMTRLVADADLRRRVSIIPKTFATAPLPPSIAGAVLGASLVHFSPAARTELLSRIAERLGVEGRVVVEVQYADATLLTGSATRVATSSIGRVDYEAWATVEQIDEDRVRWRMTYQATLRETILACEHATFDCWIVSAERLASEAADRGFAAEIDGNLIVLHVR